MFSMRVILVTESEVGTKNSSEFDENSPEIGEIRVLLFYNYFCFEEKRKNTTILLDPTSTEPAGSGRRDRIVNHEVTGCASRATMRINWIGKA